MSKENKIPSAIWQAFGLQEPVTEHRFHPVCKWRFDYAWPASRMAVEVEGIFYSAGQGKSRHQTGKGYSADMEKYNAAIELGWRVLRYAPNKIDYAQVKRILTGR